MALTRVAPSLGIFPLPFITGRIDFSLFPLVPPKGSTGFKVSQIDCQIRMIRSLLPTKRISIDYLTWRSLGNGIYYQSRVCLMPT